MGEAKQNKESQDKQRNAIQNWVIDLLVGLGCIALALVLIARPGPHA